MRLKRKTYKQYEGKVYDLTVSNTHTYNVESLAVHNSGGGSLVCYLLGITSIDPIKYGLLFERFFNVGRYSTDSISFPEFEHKVFISNRKSNNVKFTNLPDLGFKVNKDKLFDITGNDYFKQEIEIIQDMDQGIEYYQHIYNNVTLESNSQNSYIMWLCDKVDNIDLTKPINFVPGRYSLPDIDVDFPPDIRDSVITYLKQKYGEDHVCQMVTFSRLQGRSILTEVLRINNACSFDEIKEITKNIPQEAAISDKLEEMDDPSVILWTLENDPDALSDYCRMDDDGNLVGDLSKLFQQAVRLEGVFKSRGKHAAGVVISSDPLNVVCPMIKPTKGHEQIAGMEMGDLEAIGCVKFDILGVNLLSRIMGVLGDIDE